MDGIPLIKAWAQSTPRQGQGGSFRPLPQTHLFIESMVYMDSANTSDANRTNYFFNGFIFYLPDVDSTAAFVSDVIFISSVVFYL